MKRNEIFIVLIIFFACLLIVFIRNMESLSQLRILTVEVNSIKQYEINLEPSLDKELKVKLNEGTATIKINKGRVKVLPLPKEICASGRCWATGWIENSGETIICVPNRMVLSIKTKEKKALYENSFFAMDTIFSISLTEDNKYIVPELINIVEKLNDLFDVYNIESDMAKINKTFYTYIPLNNNSYDILEKAYKIAEETQGAFDPTIESLAKLWSKSKVDIPDDTIIKNKLPLVNFRNIVFAKDSKSIMLNCANMQLNLGGIAKGFAVQKLIDRLKKSGVNSALISGGGNTYAHGKKPDGSPWKIGIRNPRDKNKVIGYVELQNMALDTSGDYERYFFKDGIRYHHIINPKTGYPARDLISVTVITKDPVIADALATALFVMGPQEAINFVNKRNDIEAIMITPKMEVLVSKGVKDNFFPSKGITPIIF